MFNFGDNVDCDKLSNSNEPAAVDFRQNGDKSTKVESQQVCRLSTLSPVCTGPKNKVSLAECCAGALA